MDAQRQAERVTELLTLQACGRYTGPCYRPLPKGVKLPGRPDDNKRHPIFVKEEFYGTLTRALHAFIEAYPTDSWNEINVLALSNWWGFWTFISEPRSNWVQERLRHTPDRGVTHLIVMCEYEIRDLGADIVAKAVSGAIVLSRDKEWFYPSEELVRALEPEVGTLPAR